MRNLLIIIGLLILPVSASSQTSFKTDLKGAGASSCGTWTQDHSQGDVTVIANVEDEWVLGFVVGQELLYSDAAQKSYTINTDSAGIVAWISNYCQQYPVKQIVDAAKNFVNESNAVIPASN